MSIVTSRSKVTGYETLTNKVTGKQVRVSQKDARYVKPIRSNIERFSSNLRNKKVKKILNRKGLQRNYR